MKKGHQLSTPMRAACGWIWRVKMYSLVGTLVILFTVGLLLILVWRDRIRAATVVAMGIVGIAAGFVIPNLTFVTKVQMTGTSLTAEINRKVRDVNLKAAQVRDDTNRVNALASEISKVETSIRILAGNISEMTKENQKNSEQVKSLVAEAQNTRDEVQRLQANTLSSLQQSQQIEKNVAIMQSNVQQTWRSLFESYALAVGTRNMFPPPKEIVDDINKNLNILSRFAYPNPQERRVEVGRILNMIRAAENPAGKKDLSR